MQAGRTFRLAVVLSMVGAGGAAAALLAGGATGASRASTVLTTFTTPNKYTWTVPALVKKVTFDVYGASGGNVAQFPVLIAKGGAGGEAKGQFAVKPGDVYLIFVGGKGGDTNSVAAGVGGSFGGGSGDPGGGAALGGAGGGGDSSVLHGGIGNPCGPAFCGLEDRFIVGGGGGGGAGLGGNGYAGGGLVGQGVSTVFGPQGGFQEALDGGYAAYDCAEADNPDFGSFGVGGSATAPHCPPGDPGGGSGWYGGGAGNGNVGGGGGSGYISPFTTKGSFPGGTQVGDGKVIISTP